MTELPREKRPRDRRDNDQDLWTELVESESRLRSIIDSAGAVIFCTDEELRITEFNAAAERVFGRRRADVVGNRYSELLPPIVRAKVDLDFQRVLSGRAIRLFENVIVDTEGRTRVVLWDVRCIVDADGRATGVVAVAQDITTRQNPDARVPTS